MSSSPEEIQEDAYSDYKKPNSGELCKQTSKSGPKEIELGTLTNSKLAVSDSVRKIKGSMTTNENDEVVRVHWSTYVQYYRKYLGGIPAIILYNVVLLFFAFSKVYCDYLVGAWAYSPY